MAEHEDDLQYPDKMVTALQWMWGEGFLSPGGPEEIAAILESLDLTGTHVLDIGCGLGAIDVLLVREHGAATVVGIDVEEPLITRAQDIVARAGLSERIECRLVEPGPLSFEAESFDVVFSKDAMIHIPDKVSLYREVLRVLKPGGVFVASDWLYGGTKPYSEAFAAWLDVIHLSFELESSENTVKAMEQAGFTNVETRSRNAWYREEARREYAAVSGENFPGLVAELGQESAEHRRRSSKAKIPAVDSGELDPTHLRARKPD